MIKNADKKVSVTAAMFSESEQIFILFRSGIIKLNCVSFKQSLLR